MIIPAEPSLRTAMAISRAKEVFFQDYDHVPHVVGSRLNDWSLFPKLQKEER